MEFVKTSAVSLIFSSVIILLLSAVLTNAQTIEWTKTFGGTGDDGTQSMVVTNNGEIVIAGFKSPGAFMYRDVLLMKTDPSGNELWSRIFNLGMNDWGRCLKQTQDGGFIIAGYTEVVPQIHYPFLVKTDDAGNIQWQQQYDYGFGDDDRAHSVWQTSDGGYIIAGQTWLLHGAFGNYDMYIIKTDGSGNVQWQKVFFWENEGGDWALSVQQLSDGGYIIGGLTQSSVWASYILRLDGSGNVLWSNIYPGAWQSECYDIQPTPDGGFLFTGTESSFTTDTDLLITKLNSDGNLVWKKIYGTVDAEQGESIQQLQDGGYVIAGMSSHGAGGYDMYVVRTDANGDSLWSRTIGGSSDDRAFSVVSADAGSYILTGWTWSYGQGQGDVYLVKLLDSVVPVELTSFTAETNGSDVMLKWSTATETNNYGFNIERKRSSLKSADWITIEFIDGAGTTTELRSYSFEDKNLFAGAYQYRLKQIDIDGSFEYSDVVDVEISAVSGFILEQNNPNPFNPSTTIKFSIPVSGNTTIRVYNLLGAEVATLLNEMKSPGTYEVNFDAASLPSGTYFYSMKSGNFREVQKMILLK